MLLIDLLEFGLPTRPVEGKSGALHLIEKWTGTVFDVADTFETGLGDLHTNRIAYPQRFDSVGGSVGHLFMCEIVGGGIGKLDGSLAVGLDA